MPLPDGEETVGLTWRRATRLRAVRSLTADRVEVASSKGDGLIVTRQPATMVLDLPEEISPGALVHPLLGVPLSLLARWRGHVTLHGGAFFHAGGAWGILGERTRGKSSMLAALAERNVPIVADDLLVIDRGWALSGPRCVDLRPDVRERFPSARFLGVVGGRPRFRLVTPIAPSRAVLRGLFVLEWGDSPEPELIAMDTRERLEVLYGHDYMGVLGAADPKRIIQLLGVPAWRLRRPREWARTPVVLDRLLELTSAHT